MKRFRNAATIGSPEILAVPEPGYDVYSGGGASSIPNYRIEPEPTPISTLPVKEVIYVDPILSVPAISPKPEPTLFSTLMEKIATLVEPTVSNIPSTPQVNEVVAPSLVQAEPIKEVLFIDSALSPKLLTDEQLAVSTPSVKSDDVQKSTGTLDNLVETLNKGVNELFSTEIKQDLNTNGSVTKDNTGLYLAGAVVALGLLTLIFKK